MKIKGRDIASSGFLSKKYRDLIKVNPNSIFLKENDKMRPQDPVWPKSPLFFPAVLPVAANLPNYFTRYLGLIPDQENYHDIIDNWFDCLEAVKTDEAQQLRFYKPNFNKVSKTDVRKLFSLLNCEKDIFYLTYPIKVIADSIIKMGRQNLKD